MHHDGRKNLDRGDGIDAHLPNVELPSREDGMDEMSNRLTNLSIMG